MGKMIGVATGFQYSVNIGFDLNSDEKLKNFIPTQSALSLLEEIIMSTALNSTDRARVLIGAYGKGKSHIILTILAMLMKKDLSLFEKLLPRLKENDKLYQAVLNYYKSDNKILPVVITGSNTSIPQAFLLALQRTLAMNNMLGVMPETNYQAACRVIERWKNEYPVTYKDFQEKIDVPVAEFISQLEDFNVIAYEKFEKVYPSLTAGSEFNPFLGFDVIDLYEAAVKGIKNLGYTGIYVVYDEFSKFLEANISEASVSDTKMLQDFAEKCNRSGELQLHLMLISHKEIANYIDKLPKQKVDGWRGVSERFTHIHLNNNFTQTYEIIAAVINKKIDQWQFFCTSNNAYFENIFNVYKNHNIFMDMNKNDINKTIYNCYPLHPVSTFILPRLSERVAQNERTLFTFLSAKGISTLATYLENVDQDKFTLIAPDYIYDYFEPLFKKDVYSGDLHDKYLLTTAILDVLDKDSLESKIVKTISVIYILEQFERLQPTKAEIFNIYNNEYGEENVSSALTNLIEKELVIYQKQSNGFLRLKRSSGVNVQDKINDYMAINANRVSVKEILNQSNFDNYVYPSRYNDEKEMIRYFAFEFIEANEVRENTDWKMKSENIEADGVIYAIIPQENVSLDDVKDIVLQSSQGIDQCVFVLPKKYQEIKSVAQQFYAVSKLKETAEGNPLLFDEYEVIYEDLRDVILDFINSYTHPNNYKSVYIHNGNIEHIIRKAALTELLSEICYRTFPNTPVINNEAINKKNITSIAKNSRDKVIAALLRNDIEDKLGFSGSGQEVSIMRSTLLNKGILCDGFMGNSTLNMQPEDNYMAEVLATIKAVIFEARTLGPIPFREIYRRLTDAEYHIGLRDGVIPIYVAVVFHELKQQIVIQDSFGQVHLNADVMQQMLSDPDNYYISYFDWDINKALFVEKLAIVFSDYVIEAEKLTDAYGYVAAAMKRWYLALPKYTRESKKKIDGLKTDTNQIAFLKQLKQGSGSQELLFEKLPGVFAYKEFNLDLYKDIAACKKNIDTYLDVLKVMLAEQIKEIFAIPENKLSLKAISLASVIKDWCEQLDQKVFEQLFGNGTEKCLALFKTVTNDDQATVARLAKLATGLRIEDWDDNTIKTLIKTLKEYKATAEAFVSKANDMLDNAAVTSNYELSYIDETGKTVIKRFEKVEFSKRAKLLMNMITADVESMGTSISDQEKRQILMEILQKLC